MNLQGSYGLVFLNRSGPVDEVEGLEVKFFEDWRGWVGG